jgi:APA family basic amino acid/polyamine antiporter
MSARARRSGRWPCRVSSRYVSFLPSAAIDAILYTAAVYALYLGTSLFVIVLRFREPDVERPYKVTGYPVTPLIFSAVCAFLIYSSLNYARAARPKSLVVLAVMLAAGILTYLFTSTRKTGNR